MFISFEGGEGSGKSTQTELLNQRLDQKGYSTLLVREPGTTPLGLYLREWLKREIGKREPFSKGTELFMFAAARADLTATIIKPALEQTDLIIIADRFADSTMAYQGYGRRLSLEDVATVNDIATQGLRPDITFLLDCSPDDGLMRLSPQFMLPSEQDGGEKDPRIDLAGTRRFEQEPLAFHERVRAGYLKMAELEPDRWHVIDATQTVEGIGETVWKAVQERLSLNVDPQADGPSPGLPLWAD